MGVPALKRALHNFSKKELIRIMNSVIESPLEDKPVRFQDPRSARVVQLANHLLVCKMMMMQRVYKDKTEEKGDINESTEQLQV